MRLASISLAPALAVLVAACGAPAPEPATQPTTPIGHPDKRSLYADAGLIPTREGERIRRELALAGEIHTGLELLGLGPAHVDVHLGDEPSAVIVAQIDPRADATALEARAAALATASIPGLTRDEVRVWLHPRAHAGSESAREPTPWALALTCLGLGLSLGVTLERVRAQRRLRPK